MTERINLGAGHYLEPIVRVDGGPIIGYIDNHPGPDGPCAGFISIDPHAESWPNWVVVYDHPLTLTPSLLCRTCGNHGFVTDGKWVPA